VELEPLILRQLPTDGQTIIEQLDSAMKAGSSEVSYRPH
jgi:hypothetical protein